MDVNKRLRDLMNDEDDMEDMLESVKPLQTEKPTTNWNTIMKKMDCTGPPLKKGRVKVQKPIQPPPYQYYEVPAGYFDPYKHGYCFLKSELMYKTPDGVLHKATGVDEFGPFKCMPVRRF